MNKVLQYLAMILMLIAAAPVMACVAIVIGVAHFIGGMIHLALDLNEVVKGNFEVWL